MARTTIYIYLLVCLTSIPCVASPCWCKIKKMQRTLDKNVYQATIVSNSFKQEYLFDVKRDSNDKFITLHNQDQVFTLDLSKNKLYTEDPNTLSKGQASTVIEAIELIIAEYLLSNRCSRLQKVDQENYPVEVPLVPGDFYQ